MTATYDRTYEQARNAAAGVRYYEHRETIREALDYRLDLLRDRARSDPYYAKEGPRDEAWRRELHRKRLAKDIRDVRAALRDLPR